MSKRRECSYCKNRVKAVDEFCASCGKKLSCERENVRKKENTDNPVEYCYHCGAPNQIGDKICSYCEIALRPGSKKAAIRHYRAGIVGSTANSVVNIVELLVGFLLYFFIRNIPSMESELRSRELRSTFGYVETSPKRNWLEGRD